MKTILFLITTAALAGCAGTGNYSSVGEPVGGQGAFAPVASAPRNWNAPVKGSVGIRFGGGSSDEESTPAARTAWDNAWHGE